MNSHRLAKRSESWVLSSGRCVVGGVRDGLDNGDGASRMDQFGCQLIASMPFGSIQAAIVLTYTALSDADLIDWE
jgi:hypothetical protein